ncbi:MAG TPA: RNA-directed DNA polymerase [Chloroflexia bacterium]|nr:RNA-directed DNA polymerase [Chloroflexia bacterium]
MTTGTKANFKLSRTTYEWALKHLLLEGDTDLLPAPFEIEALNYDKEILLDELQNLDIRNYQWKGGRKFLVPKDKLVPRNVMQFDPFDSLIFAAIIKEYGDFIEKKRLQVATDRIFSSRFKPTPDGRFYGEKNGWQKFWEYSLNKASRAEVKFVVVTDIVDYYNQIYHHVLENQLSESQVPDFAINAIKGLITLSSNTVSRGLPVGPHSVHILAECAFIPIDRSFLSNGLDYCRYVDDIHVFCKTEADAQIAIYEMTNILNEQQQLNLHRQKTRILSAEDFVKHAKSMLINRPLNQSEEEILKIIKKHSNSDNYAKFSLSKLSDKDLETVSQVNIEQLLELYLKSEPVDFARIKWLLRRLSQFGAPGAVDFILSNLDKLTPALPEILHYIKSASKNYTENFNEAGDLVFNALNNAIVEHSEYMLIVLLNLFSQVPEFNHIDRLTATYHRRKPSVQREILIAAGVAEYGHWIKERKSEYTSADPWLRRAIIKASVALPGDEGIHWINKIKRQMTPLEKIVTKWAFRQENIKLGEIKLV